MTLKRRDRRKSHTHDGAGASTQHHSAGAAGQDPHAINRFAWRQLQVGLALTILLVGLKVAFEGTTFGRQVEQMTLNLQQLRLMETFDEDRLKVAVVDITGVPRRPRTGPGDPDIVTDVEALRGILGAVVDKGPAAIGVDVLLDPPADHDPLTASEVAFLEECLRANARVPTRVGIFEGVVRGRDRWLGEPKYADLAAYVLVPRPRGDGATTSMIPSVEVDTVDGGRARIDGLAESLSRATRLVDEEALAVSRWLAGHAEWMVEHDEAISRAHFSTSEFAINFGALPSLRSERHTVRATTPEDIARSTVTFAGKIVLIGRAQTGETTDVFTIPAQPEPVAGVYVHAAAADTLMQAPLFRLTHLGRFVADGVAAGLPILTVFLLTRFTRPRDLHEAHVLGRVLTWVVALIVFGIGYVWIKQTGILWTDQVMVVAALLLHAPLEGLAQRAWRRWRGPSTTPGMEGHPQ